MDADKPRNVDALIDAVATEMTDGAPSDALRPKVQRRIAAPPPRIVAWWPRAAAVAAAVMLAAVALWRWDDRAALRESPDRSATNAPVPAPLAAGGVRADAPAAAVTASTRAATEPSPPRTGRRVARQSQMPSADAPGTVDIEPLAIAPLSSAAIVVDTVSPRDIDIGSIPLRPLAIGPLASNDVE